MNAKDKLTIALSSVAILISLFTLISNLIQNRRTSGVLSAGLTARLSFPDGAPHGEIHIKNAGLTAFHDVVWWDGLDREYWPDNGSVTHGGYIQTLSPGDDMVFTGPFYAPFTEYAVIELDFRDEWGRRWLKTGPDGRKRRLRSENYRDRYPFMELDPLIPLN